MENYIGQIFGKWTILKYLGRNAKSEQTFDCQCACGTLKVQRLHMLKAKRTLQCKNCSLAERNSRPDLTGQLFGKWKVLENLGKNSHDDIHYKCQCECGTVRKVTGSSLRMGRSTHCKKCNVKTHGMTYTKTFRIWRNMIGRCSNKNHKNYPYYGGRGIKVCNRWMKFENFFVDMGECPPKLQIDRIDVNGNYEASNCRWTTAAINMANRRCSKKSNI